MNRFKHLYQIALTVLVGAFCFVTHACATDCPPQFRKPSQHIKNADVVFQAFVVATNLRSELGNKWFATEVSIKKIMKNGYVSDGKSSLPLLHLGKNVRVDQRIGGFSVRFDPESEYWIYAQHKKDGELEILATDRCMGTRNVSRRNAEPQMQLQPFFKDLRR